MKDHATSIGKTSNYWVLSLVVLYALLCFSWIWQAYISFYWLWDQSMTIDFNTVFLNLLPVLYLVVALPLFRMRKKAGWVLFGILASFSLSSGIFNFVRIVLESNSSDGLMGWINQFFHESRPLIFHYMIYAFSAFALTKRSIQMQFGVQRNLAILSYAFPFIFVCLLYFVFRS